ncbi:hypothetical protein N7X13_004367 [Salmonella enterica]|nr:hypothetical protein [Salmonella enterica]EJV8112417.1 hypothetical protein [Salmonella enterica]EJZ3940232.1 hypothetical protein [Salmonella enterica]
MKTEWTYDELTQAVKEFITPDLSCKNNAEIAEFHRTSSYGVFHFWDVLTEDIQQEHDNAQIQDILKTL